MRFIINPAAGGINRTDEITDAISRVLTSEEGIFEVRVARKNGNAKALSKEAVSLGYECVFACGGDGTVNEVATQLVKSPTSLGIIPTGSGNALARSLGIPGEIESCIRLLKERKVRNIDAGVVADRFFFSTASIGIEAVLSKRYNEGKISSARRGILPYFPIALFAFLGYRPETVVIRTEEKHTSIVPLILTVANTEEFGGGAVIAPGAKVDDGLLDVCMVPEGGLFDGVRFALKLLNGKVEMCKSYRRFKSESIEFIRKKPGLVQADGEFFEWGETVKVKVLPGALKVLVGKG